MTVRRSTGELIVTGGGHVYPIARQRVAILRVRSVTRGSRESTGFPGKSRSSVTKGGPPVKNKKTVVGVSTAGFPAGFANRISNRGDRGGEERPNGHVARRTRLNRKGSATRIAPSPSEDMRCRPTPSTPSSAPQLDDLKAKGLYKAERRIESPQTIRDHRQRPRGGQLLREQLPRPRQPPGDRRRGARRASRRGATGSPACGSSAARRTSTSGSKQQIARFFGKDDSILYISCFDANGGLFEPLLGEQDAILSDELNHASIIDGVRLCKAQRFRYKHNDMADLKAKLEEAKGCRFKLIFTDSVFSMDGDLAKLPDICDLADQYDAAVGIDDCHATGHLGADRPRRGRGTRRPRPHRRHHQHARQDARRRQRRVHGGERRGRGLAAEPVAAVPVLELGAAGAGRSPG